MLHLIGDELILTMQFQFLTHSTMSQTDGQIYSATNTTLARNNNKNNNTTIYMKSLQGHRTPGSRDECRTAPDGHQPLDQAHGLEPLPTCRAGSYETSTIAIIITQ